MIKTRTVADFNRGTLEGISVQLTIDNCDGSLLKENFEFELQHFLNSLKEYVLQQRQTALNLADEQP